MLLALLVLLIVLLVVLPIIGYTIWTLISVAIIGLIIGGLARLVLPGRHDVGILATILIGWIGSLLGGFAGDRLHVGHFATLLLEIGAAVVLLGLYAGNDRRRSRV